MRLLSLEKKTCTSTIIIISICDTPHCDSFSYSVKMIETVLNLAYVLYVGVSNNNYFSNID